jgi:hypothetical protein
MDGSWHIIKWICVTICFIWLAVQVVALRRLKGDPKRRSLNVFWVVFFLMVVSDWIRDVFENPEATRIGMVTVGAAAVVATVLLTRLLLSKAPNVAEGRNGDVEDSIQLLRLS